MDIKRYWFTDTRRLGIVELSENAISQEGRTCSYVSPTEVKAYQIDYIALPSVLTTDIQASDDVLTEIPAQFHETIVARVIAEGYRHPSNVNLQMMQVFDQEYEKGVRQGKIYAKRRFKRNINITPQDF